MHKLIFGSVALEVALMPTHTAKKAENVVELVEKLSPTLLEETPSAWKQKQAAPL